ncbi:FAD:protein FMN transferase [uncultured Fibrella sp.]|uniref:FAD:protein FMN transferase n=1 Tax=uncultured Fibrella sp. TaxID=1284596 RepID=UPI0035CBDE1E
MLLDGRYVGAGHRARPLSDRQGRVFVAGKYTPDNHNSQASIQHLGSGRHSQASLTVRKRATTMGRPYMRTIQYTFRRGLMGTTFTVRLYANDSLTAKNAYEAVSARMDTLNQIMSDYLDGSELNRLSETSGQGRWVRVSPTLFDVLQKAKTIARQSGGRYDPTIGPLSQLWRRAVRQRTRGGFAFPDARERRNARRAVSWRYIELDSTTQSVRLQRPHMRLDLGGIGQGFAIDEAQKVLHEHGIRVFLLDLGGDILAGEPPPNQPSGWRIGLASRNPVKAGQAISDADTTVILLKNAAITTSGDTERHLDINGRRYSHIMNPRTGLGLRHFVQATVLAPTGTYADALTKVFSMATPGQRKRLQRRFPQARVWIREEK